MNPLRLAGTLTFAGCGLCAGDAVRLHIQAHLDALEAVIALLQELEQEIAFRRTDWSILCQRLTQEGRLQTDFPKMIQSARPPSILSNREAACFVECFSGLGQVEADAECCRLARYRERFAVFFQQRQEKSMEQMGLVYKLGAAAGLAVGILFL